jgi:stage V sporulation protein AC
MEQNTKEAEYNAYVKQVTPTTNTGLNVCKAFLMGGFICTLGQFITNTLEGFGINEADTTSYTLLALIFFSVLLTSLGIYPKLAKFGGAGCLVPITGFANSVAAAAIEFKKEGWVFGVGAKIFTIAGPVILYGIISSWLFGFLYWIGGMLW